MFDLLRRGLTIAAAALLACASLALVVPTGHAGSARAHSAVVPEPRAAALSITLMPGWNAVYLPLEPQEQDAARLLGSVPVRSVWMWDGQTRIPTPPRPAELTPDLQGWSVYYPDNSPLRDSKTLYALAGGRAYLLDVAASGPVTWEVEGQPTLPLNEWVRDSFNLTGFHINPAAPPTFAAYFGSVEAHKGQPVYRLAPAGEWQAVDPAAETIGWGQAYWAFAKGPSTYAGPVQVIPEAGGGLDFGSLLDETTLRIRNNTPAAQQVTLEQPGDLAALRAWTRTATGDAWQDLPATVEVPALGEITLRLALLRDRLPPGDAYRGLLQVSTRGLLLAAPVTARNAGVGRTGLWVGSAIVNAVSFGAITDTARLNEPQPTASEFEIRLIVHVDRAGNAKLLQQVTLLWQKSPVTAGAGNAAGDAVASGRLVLVTDDRLIPQFQGVTLRNGQPVGRRISSAAFSFVEPVTLKPRGAVDAFGKGALKSAPIVVGYDDPLNPFKHAYNPEHDNLDPRFLSKLPEGEESFTVVREIELRFAADGNRYDQVAGQYLETLGGVHKNPLTVAGAFRLQRVSTVATLNGAP